MTRIFLVILAACCVIAQNDDTSKEEALLDELLNSTAVPAVTPVESEPSGQQQPSLSETPVPETPKAPEKQYEPVSDYSETPTAEIPESETTGQPEQPAEALHEMPSEDNAPQSDSELYAPAPTSEAQKPETPAEPQHPRPMPSYSNTPEMSNEIRFQETPDIPRFSHKSHIEDVGAECVQCHQTLFSESVRGIKSGPSMKEICSQCHNGTDAPSELLAGFSDEKKYVKTYMPLFSHTSHLQHTEKCITCHTDIYKPLKKIQTPPPMSTCTSCHNNHRANAQCSVCHENVNKLKPKTHTPRWLYRNGHGKDARIKQKECTNCHVERECTTCHRGQSTFDVHRPSYKYSHGMDARQRVVNCGYCHDAHLSCTKCHERKR